MHRIVGAMLTKSTALWSCVQHNFTNEVHESLTRAANLDEPIMQREVHCYQMTPVSPNCGKTVHLSAIYGVMMACH
jgi:hypothetical protein